METGKNSGIRSGVSSDIRPGMTAAATPGRTRTGAALAVAALLALAGCNTVAGVGEDISGAARAVQGRF